MASLSRASMKVAIRALVAFVGVLLILSVARGSFSWSGSKQTISSIRPAPKPELSDTAAVIASLHRENTSWYFQYFPEWQKHVYVVDDASASPAVPKNKGREAMVYLTYIIENYDNLPDRVLFLHSERFQWHNDDIDYDGLRMLKQLQLKSLDQQGYINLRCVWVLGCPSEIKPYAAPRAESEAVESDRDTAPFYKAAFEVLFPGETAPKDIGVSCCAQFAVARWKLLQRPKEDYVRYRDWLLQTPLPDHISGRVLEYSWHIIFGMDPIFCPKASDCYCRVFGLCDLECPGESGCDGRYVLPPYSTLPQGWPLLGWKGEQRLDREYRPEIV